MGSKMNLKSFCLSTLIAISATVVASHAAFAFCGVIEESAIGRTVEKASAKASRAAHEKVRPLRQQYGAKLKVEPLTLACLGGAVAIDANGNQIVGKPSCRATVAFCVNP